MNLCALAVSLHLQKLCERRFDKRCLRLKGLYIDLLIQDQCFMSDKVLKWQDVVQAQLGEQQLLFLDKFLEESKRTGVCRGKVHGLCKCRLSCHYC